MFSQYTSADDASQNAKEVFIASERQRRERNFLK